MPEEVVLPPHPSSVGRARRFVVEQLAALGVADPAANAELVVSELVTNAVIHTGTDVRVRVIRAGDTARVEVGDGSTVMPGPRMVTAASRSGRGLTLVDHFTSKWGVDRTSTGKVVWFLVLQEG